MSTRPVVRRVARTTPSRRSVGIRLASLGHATQSAPAGGSFAMSAGSWVVSVWRLAAKNTMRSATGALGDTATALAGFVAISRSKESGGATRR